MSIKTPNKLLCRIKYISDPIYELISDCTTYKSAFNPLDRHFIKEKDTIFVRHLLASRQQMMTENTDEFLHELHKLNKNCQFVNATAEQYQREFVRDAFIN